MNYRKLEFIAKQLEDELDISEEINERTEKEKETTEVPTPSVEAKIASLKGLIKLAKAVKKSKDLTAEEKEEALENIKKSSKKIVSGAGDSKITKQVLMEERADPINQKRKELGQYLMTHTIVKPNVMLTQLNVNLPSSVQKMTLKDTINLLHEIFIGR
jgi:hypothetical protein